MKKLLLFFFASLLLLSSCVKEFPEPIYNPTEGITGERTLEGREQSGDLYFDLYSDKTCQVADYNDDSTRKDLVIPRTYKDYTVIAVDKGCFEGCSLSDVTLPDTLRTIGERAFQRCPITSLEIPDGVEFIGKEAFDNCLQLERVKFGKNLKEVGTGAFYGCAELKEVLLPEGTERIGEEAFASLSSLEKVTLPDSVTEIGPFAFWNSGVDSLTFSIPDSVAAIGVSAFEGTAWLEQEKTEWLVVGDGVLLKYSGTEKTPTLPPEVKYVSNAFDNAPCTHVTLPDTLEGVAPGAFENVKELEITYNGTEEEILAEIGGK